MRRTSSRPATSPDAVVDDCADSRPAATANRLVQYLVSKPRLGYGVLVVSVLAWIIVRGAISHPSFYDLHVYVSEGWAIRDGNPLYGHLQNTASSATYPPFAAILFVPTTLLPIHLVEILSVVLNFILLYLGVNWSLRSAGLARDTASVLSLPLTGAALWFEPIYTSMNYGQVNLAVMALVLWDFTRPPDSALRGIGIGLASAIKVTPALLIVYLIATRRYRIAARAIGTFLLTIAVSLVVDRHSTWQYWTHYLFDTSRVGRPENAANQSIRGFLVRCFQSLTLPTFAVVCVGIMAVIAFAISCVAYYRLGDGWGVPACMVAGLLASPISWSHHWVWCVPIFALLAVRRPRWLPAMAVFASFAVWYIPHRDHAELQLAPWQIAVSGWYVLFGVGFIVLVADQARRGRYWDRTSDRSGVNRVLSR